jgi:glycine dehydrogenase subunit 1
LPINHRYLPHTPEEIKEMLSVIGVKELDDLFQDIPQEIRLKEPLSLPQGLSEPDLLSWASDLAARNLSPEGRPFFLGAGAYHRHIPPAIDQILQRGEFYTAYTPYQPELSQGTLQALFEYQSVIARLAGLDAAHSSSYDGATALADGLRMALSLGTRKKVVVSRGIHPEYREVMTTYIRYAGVEVVEIPLANGVMDAEFAESVLDDQTSVLVLQNPNFLGFLETDWPRLARRAHEVGARVLYSGDPIAMAVLTPPGPAGADIVTGDGQPLGIPLQFGGPSFGFLATRKEYIYQMPGRVIGRTVDARGKPCFVMTLRFREQDIKRHRATSNICTNNALMALRGLAYILLLGPQGLRRVTELSVEAAQYARSRLQTLGLHPAFPGPTLWEFPLVLEMDPSKLNRRLLKRGIIGGLPLNRWVAVDPITGNPRRFYEYLGLPQLKNGWLLAFTELTTRDHIDELVDALKVIL